MMLKSSVTALALGVALVSGSACAYEAGDMILRVGAAAVDPQEDSKELTVAGTKLTEALAGVADVSPATAGVGSDTQVGITFTYMLSSNVGIEVLAATPFTHEVTANLGEVGVVKAAEVTHLPPTITAQYYFMGSGSKLQPYAGIGINYTTFFDEDVESELNEVTTAIGLGNAKGVELKDSFGLAFEVGCDYEMSDNLVLNASVWKADIDTTATFKYAGGVKIKGDVDIDPMVYMVAVGYKF